MIPHAGGVSGWYYFQELWFVVFLPFPFHGLIWATELLVLSWPSGTQVILPDPQPFKVETFVIFYSSLLATDLCLLPISTWFHFDQSNACRHGCSSCRTFESEREATMSIEVGVGIDVMKIRYSCMQCSKITRNVTKQNDCLYPQHGSPSWPTPC